MARMPMVYVIDDDLATRRSLQAALERAQFRVQTFSDPLRFLQEDPEEECGCILLDLRLPAMSGMEVLERLRERRLQMPIIIITGHGDVESAVKSLKLGAIDFIQKPLDTKVVVERVREAVRRASVRQEHQAVVEEIRRRLETLTPREMEMVRLLVQGKSNKMVGAALGISTKTVANHRAHIMAKMRASNAADLVRMVLTADRSFLMDASAGGYLRV